MADFTLLDVMLGVDKNGLVCKLTEESFTFFVGLILAHNRRGFAPDFDMTNLQAMAAGGGNTPRSVRRRRLTLSKFKLDGEPLLKYESGNYGRNTCAEYEINYKKLLAYNGVWYSENGLPAQKGGGSGSSRGRVEGRVEGTVEAPSLDQIREDKTNPPTPQNEITTQESSETEEAGAGDSDSKGKRKKTEVDALTKLFRDKFQKAKRLTGEPPYTKVNEILYKHGMDSCVAAIKDAEPDANNWSGIINYVGAIAKRLSVDSRGISGEKLDKLEKEYREIVQDLDDARKELDAGKPIDPAYIEQQTERAGKIHEMLIKHGGNVVEWR